MNRPILSNLSLLLILTLIGLIGCETVQNDFTRREGVQSYRQQDYEPAVDQFEKAIRRDPADWRSHFYLGQIALQQNRPAKARHHLEIAYAIRQGNFEETPQIVDALAEALYQEGSTPQLLGFLREAVEEYGTARDYVRLGSYLERLGDHDAALNAYLTAQRLAAPDDPAPHLALADFYEKLGEHNKALVELRQAYAITPYDTELADRLRAHGVVPGPTIALPPQ